VKYGNEIKIGVALVLSFIVFYIGIRYFKDLPLFAGTASFRTSFANAGGLVTGNVVRINGVNVGAVDEVSLQAGSDRAHVVFHVDRAVVLTHGSMTSIGGVGALGVVRMEISLGPVDTTAYVPGDFVPSAETSGLDKLIERAPAIIGRADSLILGASETLGAARALMADPQSELMQTLVAIQGSANALNTLLRTEQARIGGVLEGVDSLTGTLNTLTRDSLTVTVHNVNQLLERIDANIAALEGTTATLNAILGKIDQGDGTLGKLINDATLYTRLDSTLGALNRILLDFERNPKKYLKDLKLVDVF
jgi:phospholipid/cholesterol/gamma-HCH transport system substrate-binding protein